MARDTQELITDALIHLNLMDLAGSPSEQKTARERVDELYARVRAEATARVMARREAEAVEQAQREAFARLETAAKKRADAALARRVRSLLTPYGTLTHYVTGEAIRPATARDRGEYELAKRKGKHVFMIEHMHNGVRWEEPYYIADTKTIQTAD